MTSKFCAALVLSTRKKMLKKLRYLRFVFKLIYKGRVKKLP